MNQPDRCQVCKEPFKPGDDIVICPHCGAPYHRECYQKEGHCVYTDKHAQGFEYHPPAPAPPPTAPAGGPAAAQPQRPGPPPVGAPTPGQGPTAAGSGGVVCPSCRTINDRNHIFCERCGYPLHSPGTAPGGWQQPHSGPAAGGPTQPPPFMAGAWQQMYGAPDTQGEFDGISKQDWAGFIGPSTQDYFLRMNQQDRRKSKFSFTLSAFFFSHLYFAYRKMWGWALLAVLLQVVLSAPSYLAIFLQAGVPLLPGLTADNINLLQNIALYAQIIRNMAFGVFALYLYRKDAAKKIRDLRGRLTGQDYQMALAKKGGVSVLGVVAVLAVFFLAIILLVMYGGQPFMTYMLTEGNPFQMFTAY